ncbi:MAG: DUF370 domain-containing protein [Eubacterium sp.]|nr:DUF370 domain-containing protein [Eubacterium sp.]MBQ9321468.1 DUF370 domain-containing protein [Eubacterium sp.]
MSVLINIGFGNTVNNDKVLAVVGPDAAPVRRMVGAAREDGMLIDATQGRKTKAVIILEDGRVLLSALQPETVTKRFNAGAAASGSLEEDLIE